jgi:hypothetical protein
MAERSIQYSAQIDPSELAAAERAFYTKSLKKLQLWRTVLPPIAFVAALLAGTFLHADGWFYWFFGVFLLLALLRPLVFWSLRPVAVAADARKFPNRDVRIDEHGVHISTGTRNATVKWSNIRHVWDTDNYILLVVSPLLAHHLPKKGMLDGTLEFITARAGRAI